MRKLRNIRNNIDQWLYRIDNQWRKLPVRLQYRYILIIFCGYALLTLVVLAKVWYDTSQSRNHMTIDHIRHPVLKSKKAVPDSIFTIVKPPQYERE